MNVAQQFAIPGLVAYNRSSHQRCSVKKGVLRYFAIFTGKHLCQSLFFNKVAGAACKVVSFEFCEISKNTFFTEDVWATAFFINRLLIKKCKLVKLQEQKKTLANPSNFLQLIENIFNISLRISSLSFESGTTNR